MNRILTLAVPLYFIVGAILVGATFRYPLVTDDPYITYRYAQSLISGNGFVFNAGEHVLSTTTPLYALLLAVGGLVGLAIPVLGYWVSVLSLGACAYFVFRIADRFDFGVGGVIAGAALLVVPALLMTFGLETNFYLALAAGALYFYFTSGVTIAFALCALLTLTRNDGVILTAILGLHYLYSQRATLLNLRSPHPAPRSPIYSLSAVLSPLLLYLVILLPWLIFATLYFGSPFPFTLAAKIAQAQSGLWDSFARGFVKWAGDNWIWLAPLFGFAVIGIVWGVRGRSLMLLVGAWAAAHLAAYAVLGVAFYPWYVASLFPALCLFAGGGVELAARWVDLRIGVKRIAFGAVLLVSAVALLYLELRAAVDAGMLQPAPKVEAYERAADWLAKNAAAGAGVDALEVGVIGYYDAHPTYDFVGLVDPMRIPYLRTQRFADGVRRRAADYVIAIPPDTWLPKDVWFKDAYRAVQQIHVKGFYNNRPLVIYQRANVGQSVVETREVNAAFEKWVELQKVDFYAREISAGETLPLRLHLQALKLDPVPEVWKFTVQLVGAENRVIAQTDNFYPARLPEDGKPFVDYQGVPIPKDAPHDSYDLILAMYDVQNNERLSFYDANGNEAGDFVSLGKIEVK